MLLSNRPEHKGLPLEGEEEHDAGAGAGRQPCRTATRRNALSEEVICALLRDFRQHGQKAVARVRQTQPAAYLKILALLVPRDGIGWSPSRVARRIASSKA